MTTITPAARPRPRGKRPLHVTLIITGTALVLARLVLPYFSGLFFKASISTVSSLCNSALGALVIGNPQVRSACNQANALMAGLTVAAVAGFALAAFGGWLIWRNRETATGNG